MAVLYDFNGFGLCECKKTAIREREGFLPTDGVLGGSFRPGPSRFSHQIIARWSCYGAQMSSAEDFVQIDIKVRPTPEIADPWSNETVSTHIPYMMRVWKSMNLGSSKTVLSMLKHRKT